MEQLLLFALFYERMLENGTLRQRRFFPPAETLEPILWSRVGELKASGVDTSAPQEVALGETRCRRRISRESLVCGGTA